MAASQKQRVVALLEELNADYEPELLTMEGARAEVAFCTQVRRLIDFRLAGASRKLNDATELARVTGTSLGKAKEVVATGKVLAGSDELTSALKQGDISLEQAGEIATAVESSPGAAAELVEVAKKEAFCVLKEKARAAKLLAERHRDLGARQHAARSGRSYVDRLGMVHIHLALEPHIGGPIAARAEAEAARLGRKAKTGGGKEETEPFERLLADAYAALLSGAGKRPSRRPELVILVSHEIAKRGWDEVREGEVCKIPGFGPVAAEVARDIAKDAFLSGVFYDGKDLRHFMRWSRNIPVEVGLALELGEPPAFDGISCKDCGNRFRTEFDHVRPWSKKGPTSKPNLQPRCWSCHQKKTKRERKLARAGPAP